MNELLTAGELVTTEWRETIGEDGEWPEWHICAKHLEDEPPGRETLPTEPVYMMIKYITVVVT